MHLTDTPTCGVFDIQRFSIHDGPGIRTTVFLSGCPLRCGWCQNPESFATGHAKAMTAAAIVDEVVKDRDFYALSSGGLTVSGGEPLLHLTAVRALLLTAKQQGLHTCVQTSGAVPQSHVAGVLDLVDVFQFDLKHMDTQRHRALTGAGTERIHANAALLHAHGATVQYRMPLIPGVNDDAQNLAATAQFVLQHAAKALTLVPYHRLYVDKYRALGLTPGLPDRAPPTCANLARVTAQVQALGVTVTIEG